MREVFIEGAKSAVRKLLAQGRFGTQDGRCQYLTPDGASCIAGLYFLHTMQLPVSAVRGLHGCVYEAMSDIEHLCYREPVVGSLEVDEVKVLDFMQRVHDMASGLNMSMRDSIRGGLDGHCSMPEPISEAERKHKEAADICRKIYEEVLNESQSQVL